MEVIKSEKTKIHDNDIVQVKRMGHLIEVQHMKKRNVEMPIRIFDKNHYYFVDDLPYSECPPIGEHGELLVPLHEFNFASCRSESKESLRKTFKNLREMINTNFYGDSNEKFITLTYRQQGYYLTDDKEIEFRYKEPMRDTVKLMKDVEKFIKRLKYHYKDICPNIRYINVVEPQGTGSWHCHILFKFLDVDKIYVPYELIQQLWLYGTTDTRGIDKCDNLGAYLTAYLADIPVDDCVPVGGDVVEKEIIIDGEKKKKKFIKGERLKYYPRDMRIWRASRNCDKPIKEKKRYKSIKKELGFAEPNFTQKIELNDNENTINIIQYEQYNLKRLNINKNVISAII